MQNRFRITRQPAEPEVAISGDTNSWLVLTHARRFPTRENFWARVSRASGDGVDGASSRWVASNWRLTIGWWPPWQLSSRDRAGSDPLNCLSVPSGSPPGSRVSKWGCTLCEAVMHECVSVAHVLSVRHARRSCVRYAPRILCMHYVSWGGWDLYIGCIMGAICVFVCVLPVGFIYTVDVSTCILYVLSGMYVLYMCYDFFRCAIYASYVLFMHALDCLFVLFVLRPSNI